MTDKELVRKFKSLYCGLCYFQVCSECRYKSPFVKGYRCAEKDLLPVWHDLRKNPEDLPKEYTEVLNDDGVKVELRDGHWRYVYGDEWEDDACVDHWCEIPRFEEE